jgi:hypothetical protein
MKQVLTKQDVASAITDLRAAGKKVTVAVLHAALGNRGSMSTLLRLKAEIEAETHPVTDSPEALQTFREIWAAAVEEGRKQQEGLLCELRETTQALAKENESLDARLGASERQSAELEHAKARAELELQRGKAEFERELSCTKSSLAEALQRLANAQQAHGIEAARLGADLEATTRKAHSVEMELVRAKALLEFKGIVDRGS